MKRYLIWGMLFASCTINQKLSGTYHANGIDYNDTLKLNKNGSFVLRVETTESKPTCTGQWQFLTKDTILLKCNPEGISEMISNTYISEREMKIVLLRDGKIKYKNMILIKAP
ncbi:hypothetical protein [Mucilaginibacter psychrotolerans]|uniref:Lipocalin-like domain-containing protein n=1 Tax=Mucilaginibacter psychrotolerans TaxID=1524096 RepID=A0A4Y8S451_9SPHI|nr:hypothetical protein [Mucilaginibacter psychrotolerans]TFF33350.1 hypothetical protein E2R66_26180 [Mucilaginibacter psychrotolerans]